MTMRIIFLTILFLVGPVVMQAEARQSRPSSDAAIEQQLRRIADAYYLSTCGHCASLLGAKGETFESWYGVRHVRFCTNDCQRAFAAELHSSLLKLDQRMIEDQRTWYTIEVSVVSGDRLIKSPLEFIWGNRLFRVNSAEEQRQVLADPSRYLEQLNQLIIASQWPTYGMKQKCPVQGDILDSDEPSDLVIANRMVRVCCGRCEKVVRSRPSQYLSMAEYALRHPPANSSTQEQK